MSSTLDTYMLVELAPLAIEGAIPGTAERPIKRVVRTYLSQGRAGEDLDLLSELMPDARFDIRTVGHIDN